MAPIPLSLTLSNSSTILTWLCVYVPHHLLLLLLLAGLVLTGILLLSGLLGLGWLAKRLLVSLHSLTPRRNALAAPPRIPHTALRLRSNSRHHSCPNQPPPLRCPHCLVEITSFSALAHSPVLKKPDLSSVTSHVPSRRSSDASPLNYSPPSPSPSLPAQEPRITTPPRREITPRKEYVRRSPRPHKLRKFDD